MLAKCPMVVFFSDPLQMPLQLFSALGEAFI